MGAAPGNQKGPEIPRKGNRIELRRPATGVRTRGAVHYSDQLQILVKWDDGHSQSVSPASTATGSSSSIARLKKSEELPITVIGWHQG
jgi:hypothetical protein